MVLKLAKFIEVAILSYLIPVAAYGSTEVVESDLP